MSAFPKRKYTIEEYIELLKTSEERFEYFDGELFSKAGGKFAHADSLAMFSTPCGIA